MQPGSSVNSPSGRTILTSIFLGPIRFKFTKHEAGTCISNLSIGICRRNKEKTGVDGSLYCITLRKVNNGIPEFNILLFKDTKGSRKKSSFLVTRLLREGGG